MPFISSSANSSSAMQASISQPFRRLRPYLLALLTAAFVFGVPQAAFGVNNLVCEATVDEIKLSVGSSRLVAVLNGEFGSEHFIVCDLNDDFGRVEIESCEAIHSQLIVAMATDRTVKFISTLHVTDSSDDGPDTCAEWKNYGGSWPTLAHFLKTFSILAD